MIVISDTSPLCYLILIDCIDVLFQLYGSIILPQAVYQELQAQETPKSVKQWIQNPPEWLIVEAVNYLDDSELERLDKGEQEAILLAEKIKADLIILDDKMARNIAIKRGLRVIGLLGILGDAARSNLINLSIKVNELQQTSFFVSPKLLESLIEKIEHTCDE